MPESSPQKAPVTNEQQEAAKAAWDELGPATSMDERSTREMIIKQGIFPIAGGQGDEHADVASNRGTITVETHIPVDRADKTTQEIQAAIDKAGGKIPYATFMHISLYGEQGYYNAGKVNIGKEINADFSTSPESSPIFGATLGNGALRVWEAMGRPSSFRVVEMGAGQGAMAKAFLDWAKTYQPEFYAATQYTIVERGKELIPKQQQRIGEHSVQWVHGSAYTVPLQNKNIEGIFISNELPDAFPVEVVKRVGGEVKQKFVTIENDQWVELWENPSEAVQRYIQDYSIQIQEEIEEPINLHAVSFQQSVDQALQRGAIVTIDYGSNGEVGKKEFPSTARVYKSINGQKIDAHDTYAAYRMPGEVDITTNVNFKVLENIARHDGLAVATSGSQADLLRQWRIDERLKEAHTLSETPKNWKALLSKASEFESVRHLVSKDSYGRFYAHVLVKGIPSDTICSEPVLGRIAGRKPIPQTMDDYVSEGARNVGDMLYRHKIDASEPKAAILLGQPNVRIEISLKEGGPFHGRTDENGQLLLNPFFIEQAKMIKLDYPHTQQFNMQDEQVKHTLLVQSGYEVD